MKSRFNDVGYIVNTSFFKSALTPVYISAKYKLDY